MARRKRASMREGPLADLFRSTVREEKKPPTERDQPAGPPREEDTPAIADRGAAPPPTPTPEREPPPAPEEAEALPPDPERVRAYRVEETAPSIPEPRERLSRIFADEAHEVEGPAYGREEPGLSEHHGPPRPHLPVI